MSQAIQMTKKEKEEFLSNDLIERMIHVEQRISAKFKKIISYEETEYYKSLTEKQKKSFEHFLKNKNKKKFVFVGIIFVSLIVVFVLNANITGNIIAEKIQEKNVFILIRVFALIFIGAIILFVLTLIRNKKRNKKYGRYTDEIEKIVSHARQ